MARRRFRRIFGRWTLLTLLVALLYVGYRQGLHRYLPGNLGGSGLQAEGPLAELLQDPQRLLVTQTPRSIRQQVVDHGVFVLGYAEEWEQPAWVGYLLTHTCLQNPTTSRTDDFRADEQIRTGSAALEDYRHSGYDRGHLAPAADFKCGRRGMSTTFLLSNITPQDHSFNSGIWLELEKEVRRWARQHDSILVITGPHLTEGLPTIGKNRVAVPKAFYKVIFDVSAPEVAAVAFYLPAENTAQPLTDFLISVDELEQTTGLDFLAALPDSLEHPLEAEANANYWFPVP